MEAFHTIGMAGHIDHGKTTLTKALTGIDTDHLAEEKERGISIEPGYAVLELEDGKAVSIVDVPGHNRFIRQMIAGVAGIDFVIFTIDANEGVMPQTKEHMEILEFLGIKHALIVLTKIAGLDEELLELATEDLQMHIKDTVFEKAPILCADSLLGTGIKEIKTAIANELTKLPKRNHAGSFRMSIDNCFVLKGKGIIARGTVQEGLLHSGEELNLLPTGVSVRARQLQVHHKERNSVYAGERAAINLTGSGSESIRRGDILVAEINQVVLTNRVDVALKITKDLDIPIKQRSAIRLYIGTAVVNGKIIYFDRNFSKTGEDILCQIELEEEIACKRGDRFILRRPSPARTIGGGWIIDPKGERYRFGIETLQILDRKKDASPMERIYDYLQSRHIASAVELDNASGTESAKYLEEGRTLGTIIAITNDTYTITETLEIVGRNLLQEVNRFHSTQPLVQGIPKAELIHKLSNVYPMQLVEYAVNQLIKEEKIVAELQYIAKPNFKPYLPNYLSKPCQQLLQAIKRAGLTPSPYDLYAHEAGIGDKEMNQVKQYLLKAETLCTLQGNILLHCDVLNEAINQLKVKTGAEFSVGDAKAILDISRKYLIPLLELLDTNRITIRTEAGRIWNNEGWSSN